MLWAHVCHYHRDDEVGGDDDDDEEEKEEVDDKKMGMTMMMMKQSMAWHAYYALDHPSDKSGEVGGHNMFDLVKGDCYPHLLCLPPGIKAFTFLAPAQNMRPLVKYFDERVILQLLKGGQKRRKTS